MRLVSETTPWRHIVGVSMSRALSSVSVFRARGEFCPTKSPVLVCQCTSIERMSRLPKDMARDVGLIAEMQELVLDRTVIGESGAAFFKRLVSPMSSFVSVEIVNTDSDKSGAIPRSVLVNEMVAAISGGTDAEPIEVSFSRDIPDAAALMAEIKAAPDTEEHSDLFVAIALAVWRARKIRKRIERSDMPPPKVRF